jgi:hypothetical protein
MAYDPSCSSGNSSFVNPPDRSECRDCEGAGKIGCPVCKGQDKDCDRCWGRGKIDCECCD